MGEWYRSINKRQKIFLYVVSFFLILVYGIGLICLSFLIYLELGVRGDKTNVGAEERALDYYEDETFEHEENVGDLRLKVSAGEEPSKPPAIKIALATAWAWMRVLLIILVIKLLFPLIPFIESGGDPRLLDGVGRGVAIALLGVGPAVLAITFLVFLISLIKNLIAKLF